MELNKIYNMDNLELLKQIPDNSIDVIYIDPPFSTGKVFKTKDGEIAYQDKYTLEKLINMLEPRIKEIHRTLKGTGSFYIHGDYRFIPYVRIMCDEIFGIDNFRNEIIWRYKRWTATSKDKLQSMHDTLLFYSKGNNIINHLYEPLEKPKKQNINTKDKKSVRDEYGNVIYHIQTEREIDDVWEIPFLNPVSKERTGYPTQKPKTLLERILKSSLPYNKETNTYSGIVADFFAGSGTTLEVAKELDVNYIGCDDSPIAIKYINNRLNKTS